MLNKELLLAAGTSTAESHIKLTVGVATALDITYYGYGYGDTDGFGSVTRIPQWFSKDNVLLTIVEFATNNYGTHITFDDVSKEPKKVSVTILEKGRTVTLQGSPMFGLWGLSTKDSIFTASDVGNTFTLVFDPPPDSYV